MKENSKRNILSCKLNMCSYLPKCEQGNETVSFCDNNKKQPLLKTKEEITQ